MSDEQRTLDALASTTRIGQFVSVGVVGATLEQVIVALLTTLAGVGPLAAKAVGAEASISTMFLLNDNWTFDGHGADDDSLPRRWLRSHTVRLGGLAVSFAALHALTAWTDVRLLVFGLDFWPTVANGIGIGLGMVLNYVAESLFTWRVAA
ncbi:GtrA family protein [Halobaculum sp. MBLA0147]|uniref:GtrA family protein n=1 Tax=Halobaculum sp. MBLA0147 TaxID=3079934 RepID=UPI00352605A0